VKLQRQFNRRVKKKEYSKWLLVIPPEVVDKLGWKEGDDLSAEVEGTALKLKRAKR
jgi:bifunctional DNA-binding transcriptional regulator/antitoxin component of YhaV-PrlF toxin-antitoxin module